MQLGARLGAHLLWPGLTAIGGKVVVAAWEAQLRRQRVPLLRVRKLSTAVSPPAIALSFFTPLGDPELQMLILLVLTCFCSRWLRRQASASWLRRTW